MVRAPVVICPVDFSEASRGSLRYAAAIADHFQATLTVLTVDHPLLDDAAAATWGAGWLAAQSTQHLEAFIKETARSHRIRPGQLEIAVAIGDPAREILACGARRRADLVVMSSRGATGAQRVLFGSTAERVLRGTGIPVLVTPPADPGPDDLEEVRRSLQTVLAPVDLTPASAAQVKIAGAVAESMCADIVLVHVLDKLATLSAHELMSTRLDRQRHEDAVAQLTALQQTLPPGVRSDAAIRRGNPAHEIAVFAREREAGAMVMLLGSSPSHGIGSVAYRVLCEAHTLLLAVPASMVSKAAARDGDERTHDTAAHGESRAISQPSAAPETTSQAELTR